MKELFVSFYWQTGGKVGNGWRVFGNCPEPRTGDEVQKLVDMIRDSVRATNPDWKDLEIVPITWRQL